MSLIHVQGRNGKSKFIGFVTLCLVASNFMATSQAAFGHAVETPIHAESLQSEPVNGAKVFLGDIQEANQPSVENSATAHQPSSLISPVQDEQLSSILLGFLYFVLPVGIGLAIWLHDYRNRDRFFKLTAQIATLERIWSQNLQH